MMQKNTESHSIIIHIHLEIDGALNNNWTRNNVAMWYGKLTSQKNLCLKSKALENGGGSVITVQNPTDTWLMGMTGWDLRPLLPSAHVPPITSLPVTTSTTAHLNWVLKLPHHHHDHHHSHFTFQFSHPINLPWWALKNFLPKWLKERVRTNRPSLPPGVEKVTLPG